MEPSASPPAPCTRQNPPSALWRNTPGGGDKEPSATSVFTGPWEFAPLVLVSLPASGRRWPFPPIRLSWCQNSAGLPGLQTPSHHLPICSPCPGLQTQMHIFKQVCLKSKTAVDRSIKLQQRCQHNQQRPQIFKAFSTDTWLSVALYKYLPTAGHSQCTVCLKHHYVTYCQGGPPQAWWRQSSSGGPSPQVDTAETPSPGSYTSWPRLRSCTRSKDETRWVYYTATEKKKKWLDSAKLIFLPEDRHPPGHWNLSGFWGAAA